MLYIVIETYLDGPKPVYERFAAKGRMLPDGLEYVDSWVDAATHSRCFQLMRAEQRDVLDVWIRRWSDIVAFEVVEVVSSSDASRAYRA
ncbi:MAG: DUF3303 family protein [Actinomycetota bacterium]